VLPNGLPGFSFAKAASPPHAFTRLWITVRNLTCIVSAETFPLPMIVYSKSLDVYPLILSLNQDKMFPAAGALRPAPSTGSPLLGPCCRNSRRPCACTFFLCSFSTGVGTPGTPFGVAFGPCDAEYAPFFNDGLLGTREVSWATELPD